MGRADVFDVVSDDGPHLPMQEWIAARCPRLQDRPTTGLPAPAASIRRVGGSPKV